MRLSPALRRDHRVTEPRRPEQYLRGQLTAATALTEKSPSASDHPSKKGQVRFAMFDDPRNSTGRLGGDWAIRFAAQMFVVAVLGDRAFERVSKAVGPLHNSDLACHPEGAVQSGIPVFDSFFWPWKVLDWMVAKSIPQNLRNCR